MDVLVGTSLIAAFVAGVAALFAPCCISVLLPSYLGNIFKEKYKIFFMTFVFFLGMLTVFIPIGLGASILAQLFSRYHNVIFTIGGCAPVLAGVLALSVASGTIIWGVIYTLVYVVGMTLPLFVIALFLDKYNLTERIANAKKTITLHIGSFRWRITISELISSVIFLGMGSYITYLAFNNNLYSHSDYQLDMNLYSAKFLNAIKGFIGFLPEYVWALLFIGLVSYFTYLFIKQYKKHEQ